MTGFHISTQINPDDTCACCGAPAYAWWDAAADPEVALCEICWTTRLIRTVDEINAESKAIMDLALRRALRPSTLEDDDERPCTNDPEAA